MEKSFVFLLIWLFLYLLEFGKREENNSKFGFMSRIHTNICIGGCNFYCISACGGRIWS